MSNNLYLVESPFQLISATEAANFEKKHKNILVIILSGRNDNDHQLINLVKLFPWDKIFIIKATSRFVVFRYIVLINFVLYASWNYSLKINKLFIGEFRSNWFHYIRSGVKPKSTILIDDGSITPMIQENYLSKKIFTPFSSCSRLRGIKFNIKAAINSLLVNKEVKKTPINLFTMYNLQACEGQVVLGNNFKFFKNLKNKNIIQENKVFYFGSKYSECGLISLESEITMIKKVINYYHALGIKFYYIPHRDDAGNKIEIIRGQTEVTIKRLKMPAELYCVGATKLPMYIAAGYSTILTSLPKIFDCFNYTSFKLPMDKVPKRLVNEVNKEYSHLEKQGIKVIDIEDL